MGWSWTIFEGILYWNVGIYLAVWDYISSYSLPRLRWGMFLGLFFFCLAVCMLGRQARLHCLLRQVLLLISGTKVKSQLWVLTSFCIWSGKCLLFFFFFFLNKSKMSELLSLTQNTWHARVCVAVLSPHICGVQKAIYGSLLCMK